MPSMLCRWETHFFYSFQQEAVDILMFTLLKMAQHIKQAAETRYNMERIVPKLGCNPFRL